MIFAVESEKGHEGASVLDFTKSMLGDAASAE